MGETIVIHDIDGFPAKTRAVKDAADALRVFATADGQNFHALCTTLRDEAKSFTTDQKDVAPIYVQLLGAFGQWGKASIEATEAVCNNAYNAAQSADNEFNAVIEIQNTTAEDVNSIHDTNTTVTWS